MAGGQQSSVLATKSHMASKNPIESAEDQTHVLPDRAQEKNSNRAQGPAGKKRKFAFSSPEKNPTGSFDLQEALSRSKSRNGNILVEGSPAVQTWPRFLVVEAEDPERPLSKLSPWAIEEGLKGVSKDIKIAKNMDKEKGIFLLECQSERASKNALARNGTLFVDRKIKVSPHRSLNSSKGVIHCYDLRNDTVEFLEEKLKSQGVTKVHRVQKGRSEPPQFTNTYFLTFGMPTPPECLTVAYMKVRVQPFIDRPHQCHRCRKFGHSKHKCQAKKAVCGQCGFEAHEGSCPHPPKCSNCSEAHGPASKKCRVYMKEAEILKVKSERKVSFKEAKKIVETSPLTTKPSYAAAVAGPKSTCEMSVQFPEDDDSNKGLPEDIRNQALTLARKLRESLKAKKKKGKDASAQFSTGATDKKSKTKPNKTRARGPVSAVPKPIASTSKASKDAVLDSSESEMEEESQSSTSKAASGTEVSGSSSRSDEISFGFNSPVKSIKEKSGDEGLNLSDPKLPLSKGVVVFTGGTKEPPSSQTSASQENIQRQAESRKAVLTAPKLNLNLDKYKTVTYSRILRGANPASSSSEGSTTTPKANGGDKAVKPVPFRPPSPPKQTTFISPNRFSSLNEEENSDHEDNDNGGSTVDSNDDMEYISS